MSFSATQKKNTVTEVRVPQYFENIDVKHRFNKILIWILIHSTNNKYFNKITLINSKFVPCKIR